MKINILIFSFIVFFTQASIANIENKIILKVENKIVTNFELKNKILSSLIINKQEINQENINNLKKQSLDALVLLKLKNNELIKYDLNQDMTKTNARVNDYLNKVSTNNINNLKKVFKNNGIDYELFIEEVRTEIRWQNLIYQIYSKKIQINENTIEQEVDNIVKYDSDVVDFNLSEIEIFLNNDESDNQRIIEIKKNINEIGFEESALRFSSSNSSVDKGDLGWLNSKALSKQIYNIISGLKIGDVSEPIRRSDSVIFLMLKNKRVSKSNQVNKTELKQKLINQKKNELFNLYSQSHLSKLKNTSLIEYQ